MKLKLLWFFVIFSISFANADIICNNSETNEVFVIENSFADNQFENLQKKLEQKISESMTQITKAIKENTNHLENRLNDQLSQSEEENKKQQFANILESMVNFEKLILDIIRKLDNQEQNINKLLVSGKKLENANSIENGLDIFPFQYLSNTIEAYNKYASKNIINSIHKLQQKCTFSNKQFENNLEGTNSIALDIRVFNKLKNQEQNINNHIANNLVSRKNMEIPFDILTAQLSHLSSAVESYNKTDSNEILHYIHKLKLRKCMNKIDNITEMIEWPTNCKRAMEKSKRNGIYEIQLAALGPEPFKVLCDNEKHNGNWTVVMRRFDGSVDFNRNWTEYKNGFGNLSGEFFIGLEKLHIMTSTQGRQDMLILLKFFHNDTKYILYDTFTLGKEDEGYMIKNLKLADSTVCDFLKIHVKFSTKDVDHDIDDTNNCVSYRSGAGWHENCEECAHLFGLYNSEEFAKTMKWDAELESVEMLIRPQDSD